MVKLSRRNIRNFLYRQFGINYYDITASTEYGYCWFRIPKTGTSSFKKILNENIPPSIDKSDIPFNKDRFSDLFKFTIIRNPWGRLVSVYKEKVLGEKLYEECFGKDFDFFIDYVASQNLDICDGHLRRQSVMFPIENIDYVGRFERLPKEIQFIFNEKLDLDVENVHLNATPQTDYRTFYDARQAKLIGELYRDDVHLGSYSF